MPATLNGLLADDGGEVCAVRFQWGPTVALGTDTPWQGDGATVYFAGQTFSEVVTGLAINTVYYYRSQARNSAGISSGAILSFNTIWGDTVNVLTLPAVVSETEAILNGYLMASPRDVSFEWGDTPAYGLETTWRYSTAGDFNATLTGLTPNTVHHFRARTKDNSGNLVYGVDMVFVTLLSLVGPRLLPSYCDDILMLLEKET